MYTGSTLLRAYAGGTLHPDGRADLVQAGHETKKTVHFSDEEGNLSRLLCAASENLTPRVNGVPLKNLALRVNGAPLKNASAKADEVESMPADSLASMLTVQPDDFNDFVDLSKLITTKGGDDDDGASSSLSSLNSRSSSPSEEDGVTGGETGYPSDDDS
jgi:hypothetical protein